MEHKNRSITFSKVKSNDRWRVQMSIFGMIFTISNTPMKFRSVRDVQNIDEKAKKVKLELLLDRGNVCELCGTKLDKSNFQTHHIKPISIHPELRYDKENMMLLCRECHSGLHAAATEKANMILISEARNG